MPELDLDKITVSTANSPAELMDWYDHLMTMEPATRSPIQEWAFRGQPQTYGNLAHSFQRVFHNNKSISAALLIESKLIEAFRKHYNTLPEKTSSMPIPNAIDKGFDLKCLSVMQHYGVPTRLLDWTSEFWTAVYFACAGYPGEDAELWYFDRGIFSDQGKYLPGLEVLRGNAARNNAFEPLVLSERHKTIIFEFDPRHSPRMIRQMALHTVSTGVFADHAELLYDLFGKQDEISGEGMGLYRIIISKGCKEKTLKFLDEDKNVNASIIFPDVEGLGRFLRWQLDSLLTTLF